MTVFFLMEYGEFVSVHRTLEGAKLAAYEAPLLKWEETGSGDCWNALVPGGMIQVYKTTLGE